MTRPLALFVLSFLMLIAAAVGLVATNQPDTAGDAEGIERLLRDTSPATQDPQPITPPPAPPSTLGPSTSTVTTTSVPIASGLLPDLQSAEIPLPTALRLSSIGVEAPVVAMGVDQQTGQMEVPTNVREVAWYRHGPAPGEPGSAVLAAHVDLAGQGPGVFFDLRLVAPGEVIVVEFSDGSDRRFRVEARTEYEKDSLPLDLVFARQGSPVLTLITCGGSFDQSSSRYDSNIVVYAVPIPDHEAGLLR